MSDKLLIMLVLCISYFNSSAQDSNTFTLEEAKLYALEHNLSVENAKNEVEIAHKKVTETTGIGLPQISFNGTFNHFINLPVTVMEAKFLNPAAPDGETIAFKAGTDYTSTGTLQANQILFNGSYIVALQVSSFFIKFQESMSDISKEDVVFNVIQAYELAAVANLNKVFLDSLVASTEKLIQKQQVYLDLGLMLQEDMDQLSYSLLSAKSAQTAADIQSQNALYMLKLSMGYPMNDPISITNSPTELLAKNSNSKGDLTSNLTYVMMEKQLTLSKYNVKNSKFENLPSLNAFFQQSYSAFRNEFNFFANEKWYPQTLWGLQLNVPIFSGLSRYARTSQAKIKLLNDQNSLTQMERTLQFQELQLKNNLKGAENRLDLQGQNVELAKSIYNNEIIKENIGKGNSILVTQKHTQLMLAQSQYIGSMVELFQARLSMDKLYNNILPNQY